MPHIQAEPGDFSLLTPNMKKRTRDDVLASKRIVLPPFHEISPQIPANLLDIAEDSYEQGLRQRIFAKRQRLQKQSSPTQSLTLATSHISSSQVSYQSLSPKSHQPSTFCLLPCHVCHRRPTTKETLGAYSNCEICAQRSCYICLRSCDAVDCSGSINTPVKPSGFIDEDGRGMKRQTRSRRICSSCAVEGLNETGAVAARCLDCVLNTTPRWQTIPPG
ncbi:uncharacterized protein BO72DRAFT_187646 [Aspergillus fijiensis CBS 313.89]|uniref:Uncharacterized protein n=1 Tax=Aspergillus fijiensis CBS 313.89 TaxID=1448319 RepID=A0A8G1VX65_9EURO|nr:uncharacterized protein BO72DRAFT_187646 [Aspergillus fijiensis CBS 313.89]RAK74926.1 hypothetical protein BO72DRAFT_187646 [Aspergillus fijiensis CBS 313.89]